MQVLFKFPNFSQTDFHIGSRIQSIFTHFVSHLSCLWCFFFFNDIYFSEEFREFVLQNIPLSYCVYLFLHDWSQVKLFHMCVCVLVTELCPTLCDPMDCSPPGSSVHGILQARILEWVAFPSSRGSSQSRDWTWVSSIAGRLFIIWDTREAHTYKNNT